MVWEKVVRLRVGAWWLDGCCAREIVCNEAVLGAGWGALNKNLVPMRMLPSLRLSLCVLFFAGLAFASALPMGGAEKSYEEQLAAARGFAGEKSWALAREAFAGASRIAPDVEARRRCDLAAVNAAWREDPGAVWYSPAGSRRRAEIESLFDALLSDYEKNSRTRDSFWVDVMRNRAEFHGTASPGYDARLKDLESLADFFASQPANEGGTIALVGVLHEIAAEALRRGHEIDDKREDLRRRFASAGQNAALSAEDRAWCVLQHAMLSMEFPKEVASLEMRAHWLDATQGTRWLPVAQARLFVYDTLQARASGDIASDTPADVPALMEKTAALRRELAAAPQQVEMREADELLERLLKWWTHPMLEVDAPDFVAPGASLRFNYATANCGEITAELYQFPDDMSLPAAAYELMGTGESPDAQRYTDWRAKGTLIKRMTLRGSPGGSGTWVSESTEIAGGLKPGFYKLGLTGAGGNPGEPKLSVVNITVTDFRAAAVFEKEGAKRLLVYRQDSGAPAAGMEISGVRLGKAWSAKTDENGFATLPEEFVWETGKGARREDFLAFAEGQPIWMREQLFYPFTAFGGSEDDYLPRPSVYADVFFDRPLYRPGETVHWKIIARERRDGRFVPCEKKLALTIANRSGEKPLVDGLPLALNKNGTAHGEFALPVSIHPARVGAKLSVGSGDAKNEGGDVYLSHASTVDNYLTSAIRASAEQLDPRAGARPGADLVFVVRAEYLSGGPITSARVRAAFDIEWSKGKDFPEDLAEKINGWIESRKKEQVELATDFKGEARVRLPLPAFLCEGIDIYLDAHVLIDGAAPAKATASATVAAQELLRVKSLKATHGVARPGERVVFNAQIESDSAGKARAFSGEARVMEMKWEPHWYLSDGTRIDAREREALLREGGPEAVALLRPVQGDISPNWSYSEVARFPVSCGGDGHLKISFTPERAGLYTVQLFGDGGGGSSRQIPNNDERLVETVPTLVVAGEATTDLAFSPKFGRVLGLEEWSAGNPARALVVMPEGMHRGVLTVFAENEVVTRLVSSAGRVAWVSIERAPVTLGGVQYMLWNERFDRHSELASAYGTASVKSGADDRIVVEVIPDAAVSRPGETANVKIVARDSQGRAVPSELAVAVSDQAVGELAGDDEQEPIMDTSSWWKFAEAQVGVTFSWSQYTGEKRLRDFRPGALLNPSKRPMTTYDLLNRKIREEGLFLTSVGGIGAANSVLADTGIGANIRRHFASTAFWAPEVMTDAKGEAVVAFKYPDNLTQWNIRAVAVGEDGNSFGDGVAFTKTSLPFQARVQVPRFLIEGDSAVLSALLVNTTDETLVAEGEVKVGGTGCSLVGEIGEQVASSTLGKISVAAQSDARVRAGAVSAGRQGVAVVEFSARAGEVSDGMEAKIPVIEDGFRQDVVASARLAPGARECSLAIDLPRGLDRSRARVSLLLSPNQAAALLDALPFLIDYPYGCVEQTMSRFLPAVLVKKTFADLGVDAGAVEGRIIRGSAGSANLPIGTPEPANREIGVPRNAAALDDVISQSLARLAGAEIEDGNFGWWPGARRGDAWMTAYVGWGLHLARGAGVAVSGGLLERVTSAMVGQVTSGGDEKCADDVAAWTLSVLAQCGEDFKGDEGKLREVFARVYAAREGLSASGRACLLMASGRFGGAKEGAVLLRNLENGARRVRAGGNESMGDTVHWGAGTGYFRAEEGAVESTALSLLALLQADAAHPLVEPAVNWLMLNRRGSAWQNTRATAFAVLALNRYLAGRAAAFSEARVEVSINGGAWREVDLDKVGGASISLRGEQDAPTTFNALGVSVDASLLREGGNTIALRRVGGTSPVYATALASVWASGEGVRAAGHLVAVSRDFIRQKIERVEGGGDGAGGAMRIVPVAMGASAAAGNVAAAGELVTARARVSVPNALDYVMVTVPKPAGCEPVNALSGWDARLVRVDGKTGAVGDGDEDDEGGGGVEGARGRRIYREEHDDHSAFFLDHVEAGEWEIRFTMRAVTPGDFRALPARVEAMYVPEVRANSDARRVVISP